MNRLLLIAGALLILFSACNKTDEPVTAEEDLRTGTWIRTSGRVTYKDSLTHGDSTKGYIDSSKVCRFDNWLNFGPNNEGTIQLGVVKCVSGEPDTRSFTWQMSAAGKRISLYHVIDFFPVDNVDADVLTQTLGYLTIRYKVVTVNTTFQTADTFIYTDVLRRL